MSDNTGQPKQRLAVAVLCSDGPHHRYLVSALGAAGFDLSAVVIEPDSAQRKRTFRARRYRDWYWSTYHSVRRKALGLNAYRRRYFSDAPIPVTVPRTVLTVDSINSAPVIDLIARIKPDITIVMGTSILSKRLLGVTGPVTLNVHGGYLPDYRGNHCFFFAVSNGDFDKIGSTIHFVDANIDSGDLVEVIKPPIRSSDNPERLYCRAEKIAIHHLVTWLHYAEAGGVIPRQPQPFKGKLYRTRDRKLRHELSYWWRRTTGRLELPDRPDATSTVNLAPGSVT